MAARPRRSRDAADRARDGRGALRIRRSRPHRRHGRARAASPGCASASRRRAASRSPPASRRSACPRSRRSQRRMSRRAPITPSSRRSMRATSRSISRCSRRTARRIVTPRLDRVRAAVRAVPVGPTVDHRLGRGAGRRALAERIAGAARRGACRARHRLGRAPRRRRAGRRRRAEAALSAPARCAPAGRRPAAAPMMAWLARLFGRAEPALVAGDAARRRRARRAACGLVQSRLERAGIRAAAHRPQRGRRSRRERARATVGFILSRRAADEAEILSVAVARAWRGRGLARAPARSASAPPRGPWPARGVPRSRRGQRAGAQALCARRFSRSRPPAGLLCAGRRQAAARWCCAATLCNDAERRT